MNEFLYYIKLIFYDFVPKVNTQKNIIRIKYFKRAKISLIVILSEIDLVNPY